MSNREGLASLCVGAGLLIVGGAIGVDLIAALGVFGLVLGLAILAWNLIEQDRKERRGG